MPVGPPANRGLLREVLMAGFSVAGAIWIFGRKRIGFCAPNFSRQTTPILLLPGLFVLNSLFWGQWRVLPGDKILILAATCFCIGLWEEVLFRGVLFEVFKPFGKRTMVVWSSVLFGLLHFKWGQVIAIEFALVAGLALALSFSCLGSLWPGIILHGMIDFAQFGIERSRSEAYWSVALPLIPISLLCTYVLIKHPSFTGANKGGPANGSQPIRPETNSTSSAAGSRR